MDGSGPQIDPARFANSQNVLDPAEGDTILPRQTGLRIQQPSSAFRAARMSLYIVDIALSRMPIRITQEAN